MKAQNGNAAAASGRAQKAGNRKLTAVELAAVVAGAFCAATAVTLILEWTRADPAGPAAILGSAVGPALGSVAGCLIAMKRFWR